MKPIPTGLATAVALAALTGAPAGAGVQGPAAAPQVDMEAVLVAAQVDPQRADQAPTPGSAQSVRVVERALQSAGLLDADLVDGHYGTTTVSAYAEHQRSLGLEGAAATGLPGEESLRSLGADRFEVTDVVAPGARTSHGGETVNARTDAMLTEAEQRLGLAFELDQGSYNPGGDPTSAGTHDGGGVVDLAVRDLSDPDEAVEVLRTVGFAAWYRTPAQGDWPAHIHAVAISDPDLAGPAQHQVGDYYLGRNGLADEGPDDGPQVTPIRAWEEYQRTN